MATKRIRTTLSFLRGMPTAQMLGVNVTFATAFATDVLEAVVTLLDHERALLDARKRRAKR